MGSRFFGEGGFFCATHLLYLDIFDREHFSNRRNEPVEERGLGRFRAGMDVRELYAQSDELHDEQLVSIVDLRNSSLPIYNTSMHGHLFVIDTIFAYRTDEVVENEAKH